MKYLSLFSGVGGFEVGIGDKGECVGFSEFDNYILPIYQKHFPTHKNYGDITKIETTELPDFELLVGGSPCQDLSVARNIQQADTRKGLDGAKSGLFFHFVRILKDKKPKNFIWENVKGALSSNQGWDFAEVQNQFSECGYDIEWQVLNSYDFGVPQRRERIFVIGHLRGESQPRVFPIRTTYRGKDEKQVSLNGRNVIRPVWRVSDSESTRRTRLCGSTLRWLTQKELARLQGFPDNWFDGFSAGQARHAAGNAVTVNVIRDIIEKLLK